MKFNITENNIHFIDLNKIPRKILTLVIEVFYKNIAVMMAI